MPLSALQNYTFCHVKTLLDQITLYNRTIQNRECFSEDETEDTLDETTVYLRDFYFYLYIT